MNCCRPVGILWCTWRFSNGCEIKRKLVKQTINVVVAVRISPNKLTVQFVICFSGNFSSLSLLNTHSNTVTCTTICLFKNASDEKTQGVGYAYGGCRGSVGMGIL